MGTSSILSVGGLAIVVASALTVGCGSSASGESGGNASASPPGEQGDDSHAVGDPGRSAGAGGSNSSAPVPIVGPGGPQLGIGGASTASGGAPGSVTERIPADPSVPTEPQKTPALVNPFTLVSHDPLSTFAADVDTASYDQFVRDVGMGHLPSPATVRTEEFINYFTYDYAAPASNAAEPFSISLGAAPSVFADGTTTLRVGIQGRPAPTEKKPVNLVFLVDVSGSMQAPQKLPLVQLVLTHALDVLAPTDTVSIVTYASGTKVVLAPTPAENQQTIAGVVSGLSAGGSTNGAGGIQLAYEQATAGFIEGGINHVVLCTDGDFNIGISDTTELVRFITEKRKTGVTLTALGFGSVVNDSMMEAVSNAGNGTYAVLTSASQATRYVDEQLVSALTYIAQDVKIQVEFNPSQVYAYRLMGYEDRAIPDAQFRNDLVDAGEISAGHRVTALYQLVVDGGTIPEATGAAPLADGAPYAGARQVAASDLVLVKVRYKDVGASEIDAAHEVAVALPASAVSGTLADSDADLQFAVAVGAFSEILRGSPYAKPAALETIASLVNSSTGTDADRTQFASLFNTARPMILAR